MAFPIAVTATGSASDGWTIVLGAPGTSEGISGGLSAASCAGTTCWAVGSSPGDGRLSVPAVIESDSGAGWSLAKSPSPPVGATDDLAAISCPDADHCWAVGRSNDMTLVEQYVDGTWAYQTTPNPVGSERFLNGVSCVGPTDCWAVGTYQLGQDGSRQTLIEQYTGTQWSIVPSPNSPDPDVNILNGVACPTSNDCWAVGGAGDDQPFIEHFDGKVWSLVGGLAATGPDSSFNAVTCTSENDCWAVGVHNTSYDDETQSLIEHYDGSAWTVVPSPNPWGGAYGQNYLYGVSCARSDACYAVGYSFEFLGDGYGQTLIEAYSPSTGWTAAGPDPAVQTENFAGVWCGPTECVAVGANLPAGEPLIAQSSVAPESGAGGAFVAPHPSPPSETGVGDPLIPDTGVGGTPWAPLLLVGGATTVAFGRRCYRRGIV